MSFPQSCRDTRDKRFISSLNKYYKNSEKRNEDNCEGKTVYSFRGVRSCWCRMVVTKCAMKWDREFIMSYARNGNGGHNSTLDPPNQSLYGNRNPGLRASATGGEIYSTVTAFPWPTNHGAADSGEIQIAIPPFGGNRTIGRNTSCTLLRDRENTGFRS